MNVDQVTNLVVENDVQYVYLHNLHLVLRDLIFIRRTDHEELTRCTTTSFVMIIEGVAIENVTQTHGARPINLHSVVNALIKVQHVTILVDLALHRAL